MGFRVWGLGFGVWGFRYLGFGVPYFSTFFLKGTIMKYKFILFLPGYLKAQLRDLKGSVSDLLKGSWDLVSKVISRL